MLLYQGKVKIKGSESNSSAISSAYTKKGGNMVYQK